MKHQRVQDYTKLGLTLTVNGFSTHQSDEDIVHSLPPYSCTQKMQAFSCGQGTHPEVKYMLPHYLSSDDKHPLYTGNSLYSIVLEFSSVIINRFGQSVGNHQAKRPLSRAAARLRAPLDESSETIHGLSNQ